MSTTGPRINDTATVEGELTIVTEVISGPLYDGQSDWDQYIVRTPLGDFWVYEAGVYASVGNWNTSKPWQR